jgi:DTW domain-containing protein YfiP
VVARDEGAGVVPVPSKKSKKGRRKAPLLRADGLVEWRPSCLKCFRPHAYCVCSSVESFQAHCDVLILQHPNERKKYYSTIRIVKQAIKNSRILSGVVFDEERLRKELAGKKAYILFPGESSVDCASVPLDENCCVIVIDGTWSEAGKIVRRNPFLMTLPRVSFAVAIESRYRIRKQPKAHCLSSLESIAHLLRVNAEAQGISGMQLKYESLLTGFDRMVEQQLKHFPRFKLG